VSPRFGPYDYPGIIAEFRKRGFQVMSEVRPKGTDVSAYAGRLTGQIRALLDAEVDPSRITVVGASKGAVIAALASTWLRNPRLRYVLIANCNPWLIRTHDPRLTGEVLSIYEASDDIGKSCGDVAQRSPAIRPLPRGAARNRARPRHGLSPSARLDHARGRVGGPLTRAPPWRPLAKLLGASYACFRTP